MPSVDGKIAKCERFMPMDVNETTDSICPWNFNQTYVASCQDFVYLTHEHYLLNEVRKVFVFACLFTGDLAIVSGEIIFSVIFLV